MTLELWLALGGLFVSIALLTGLGVSVMLAGRTTEQRRLREMATAGGAGVATLSFGAVRRPFVSRNVSIPVWSGSRRKCRSLQRR